MSSLRLAVALVVSCTIALRGQAPEPSPAPACPVQRGEDVSLVLSGGAAKGIAHVGVLRVLDSLGIRATTVTGTSMGALVGALHAGGMTGRELDSLVHALPLEALFGPYLPRVSLTGGELASPVTILSPAFVVEERGGSFSLRSPVAREPQLDALLNRLLLRANLRAAGDFDRLPRRFRAVATVLATDSAVVLGEGDLAEAVRASIAIPLVFSPVLRDGRVLIDGGLSSNVPVAAARRLAPGTPLVVSDVGGFLVDSTRAPSTATLVGYLLDELFTQPPEPLGARDVLVRPETQRFLPLDFSRETVDSLIARGYRAAAQALAGCAPAVRAPAGTGGRPLPVLSPDEQFVADRVARVVGEGEFESVWLRPRPASGDSAGIAFAPIARPAPPRLILGGVAYDAGLGAELWAASARNAIAGGRLRAGGTVVAGESRQRVTLELSAAPRAGTSVPSRVPGADDHVLLPDPRLDVPPWSTVLLQLVRPELAAAGSREIIRFPDARGRERARTSTRDVLAFAGAVGNPTAAWQVAFGPVAHAWRLDRGALADGRTRTALGGMVRAARVAPFDAVSPVVVRPSILAAEALWLDRYWRAGAEWNAYVPRAGFVLRHRGALGWGESLPMSRLLVLGGTEGFPGLHREAWRATRSASLTAGVLRQVVGPVSAYADVAAGWTSLALAGEPQFLTEAAAGSVAGAEAGLTATTPIGTAVIGYGRTTRGSSVLRIQLGR